MLVVGEVDGPNEVGLAAADSLCFFFDDLALPEFVLVGHHLVEVDGDDSAFLAGQVELGLPLLPLVVHL